ncbi:MAG TPA: DMT family transporter [Gemmataceae bacterium]|nr:DMT family transporter [Gemmataceae bacterium]
MGLLAALLSAFFSSSKDLMSKRLAYRLDGTVSTFASFAFALPFYLILLAVLWLRGAETFTCSLAFLTLVLLRSLTDTVAEWMKMHAFAHGDLSIVVLILSLSPLLLLITSPLLTGDPLTLPEVASVFLVVAGSIWMVYRPSGHKGPSQKRGILLAGGAALFFSLNSCFDRLAVERGTPVFSGFTMTLLSAVFLCPFVLGRTDRLGSLRTHFLGFLTRGLLETAFMVCKLYALQTMHAPALAGIQRLSLLLSIIGGRVFFQETDFKRRLAAGCLIVAGVAVIAWWQLYIHPRTAG